MYIVQKKDFWNNWVEVYRAQRGDDAMRFRDGMGEKYKDMTRIIHI